MIIEVRLISPRFVEYERVRYFDYFLPDTIVKEMLQKAKSYLSIYHPILKRLVLLTWQSMDGHLLKFAIAYKRKLYVVVIADQLETDKILLDKAATICINIARILERKHLKDLESRDYQEFVEAINESSFDYDRFVLFGLPRVGKTTIFSLATQGTLPTQYTPSQRPVVAPHTVTVRNLLNRKDFREAEKWYLVANHVITLYDLPGAPELQHRWKSYLRRADVGILVLRSSRKGVVQAKKLLMRFKEILPDLVIAIANYQDEDESLSPDLIERFLRVRTYGMVAIDIDRASQIQDLLKTIAVTKIPLREESKYGFE